MTAVIVPHYEGFPDVTHMTQLRENFFFSTTKSIPKPERKDRFRSGFAPKSRIELFLLAFVLDPQVLLCKMDSVVFRGSSVAVNYTHRAPTNKAHTAAASYSTSAGRPACRGE